jgi:hypothetical protein
VPLGVANRCFDSGSNAVTTTGTAVTTWRTSDNAHAMTLPINATAPSTSRAPAGIDRRQQICLCVNKGLPFQRGHLADHASVVQLVQARSAAENKINTWGRKQPLPARLLLAWTPLERHRTPSVVLTCIKILVLFAPDANSVGFKLQWFFTPFVVPSKQLSGRYGGFLPIDCRR